MRLSRQIRKEDGVSHNAEGTLTRFNLRKASIAFELPLQSIAFTSRQNCNAVQRSQTIDQTKGTDHRLVAFRLRKNRMRQLFFNDQPESETGAQSAPIDLR
jgi:hypothetical protein